MTPAQLGKIASRALQSHPTVDIPFDVLKSAGLGYPATIHNGRVLEWWAQDKLDAWCTTHRIRVLPIHFAKGCVVFSREF
jgi:hypothetical protein